MASRKSNSSRRDASPEKANELSLSELLKKTSNINICGYEDISTYEKVDNGQEVFGDYYKARHQRNKNLAVVKKIRTENQNEGFPITALREIRILKQLNHQNIVKLIEVCQQKGDSSNGYATIFFFVFEFWMYDLACLLRTMEFSLPLIKMVVKDVLTGLCFIHENKIIHMNIKPSNIVLARDAPVKIGNFSLARPFGYAGSADKPTNNTDDTWYTPPEILLHEKNCGPAVDLWSVGCVMAEMLTRQPIMKGKTEIHQLVEISNVCGSITPETYPGCKILALYEKQLPQGQKRNLKEKLMTSVQDPQALDLLDKLLTIDPVKRIDCYGALNHDFFSTLQDVTNSMTLENSSNGTEVMNIDAAPSRASASNDDQH